MRLLAVSLLIALPACIVPEDARPGVALELAATSQHNHRGMPQNERGGLQPSMAVDLPIGHGDTDIGDVNLLAWANMDLSDSTGDAWFPNGHGGRFSQIDFVATFTRQLWEGTGEGGVIGPVSADIGLHNYNLPNGLEFPFGERGATTELFVTVSGEVLGAVPALTMRYDYDEVDDFYFQGSIYEEFPLGERFVLWVRGWLGYSRRGQSSWNYGVLKSGFADLGGTIAVDFDFDQRTTLGLAVSGSTILDDTIADWFDVIAIDSDNVWISGSVRYDF